MASMGHGLGDIRLLSSQKLHFKLEKIQSYPVDVFVAFISNTLQNILSLSLLTSSKAKVEDSDDTGCGVENGEDNEEVVEGASHVSRGEDEY